MATSESDVEHQDQDESILYDLTVHAEWKQENDIFKKAVSKDTNVSLVGRIASSTQRTGWTLLRSIGLPLQTASPCYLPPGLVKLINCRINWHVADSRDGKLVAVLQDHTVEIRNSHDEYSSVTGRFGVQRDAYPQWRLLAWNPDSTMLACSFSSGRVDVFDIVGTVLCTIPGREIAQSPSAPRELSDAVAALQFIENKQKEGEKAWPWKLMVVNYHGKLSCYDVDRDQGFRLQHIFLFNQFYPLGISCVEWHEEAGLLYVGGCGQADNGGSTAQSEGLTAWRILSDNPHYKLVTNYSEDLSKSAKQRSFRQRLKLPSLPYIRASNQDGVFKLRLSPNGRHLACVHCSGRLSLWSCPGLTLQKSWTHEEQKFSEEISPEFAENPLLRRQVKDLVNTKNLVDISWWSNEAMILARGTGAVTVSSISHLHNLLGSQPEWFEPAPVVTQVHDGGFLGLESECRFLGKRRFGDAAAEEDESDEEEGGMMSQSWRLAKQGMHYITDMDTFKPPKKRPRLVNRTYRLVCLKSTTPEELFKRKLENEEYGEAKALAQRYGLDTDLVYQRQWRKSPVEIASIQDYLGKISKRSWVLHECTERMSDKIDAMKELLEFGLRGTDLQALIMIGQGQDQGRFILCDPEDGLYDDIDMDPFDPDLPEKKRELLKQKRDEQMKEVDFKNLTLEQVELCRARKKLIQYLYRLKTYECILGGLNYAAERYDQKFFEKFRSQNMVTTAVEYAQSSDWKALETLFTFHGKELLPHRLAILGNFPETTSPQEYKSLLPGISEGVVEAWPDELWEEEDWVETEPCRAAIEPVHTDPGAYLYEEQPHMAKYRGDISGTMLSDWYQDRAVEIEKLSRHADFALELIKLGVEMNVQNLEGMLDDLVTLDLLVYSCNVDDSFTFQQLTAMTDYEKVELIMSLSSKEMYPKNLRKWLVPFLKQCERQEPGAYSSLLHDYVVTMARADLTLPLKVFESSKTHLPNPVIEKQAELMSMAIDAIYSCQRDDQLQLALDILKCLPQRGYGADTKEVKKLHITVDRVEHHLNAARVLEENGIKKPVYFIRDTENDGDEAERLITKLTRLAVRKPSMSEAQWSKLHGEIMELRDKVYRCISPALCHEIFVESLLCSSTPGYIQLAGRMMETSKDESNRPTPQVYTMHTKVVYDRAIQLVLSAAQEYFNSSADLTDTCMTLARSCLTQIQDNPPPIQEESDLISALMLLDDFGVTQLPLQVRLCKDRLDLVQKAISGKPGMYKNTQKLLRLGHLLRVPATDSQDRESQVYHLIARAAVQAADYPFAHDVCIQLMSSSHGQAWDVCVDLAEQEQFTNVAAKVELLSFAVTFCGPDMIEPILQARALLETQVLYEGINSEVIQSEERSMEEKDRRSPFSTAAALKQTRDILTSTQQTTKAVLSTVTDSKWWHRTVKVLKQPTQRQTSADYSDRNEKLERMACHPFYEGVNKNCYLDLAEGDLRNQEVSVSPSLEVNEKLLRTAQLEQMITEGEKNHSPTDVLLQLAKENFCTDTSLSLAYLLALQKPAMADPCLEDQPKCDLLLQLSLYYYVLQMYAAVNPASVAHQDRLYLHPPVKVMRSVTDLVLGKKDVEWPSCVLELVERIHQYTEMLGDYRQGKTLQQLGRGINIARFTEDREYKEETILGLAMSLEDSMYQICVGLAERHGVPLWQVYVTHLEFLFCDSGLSVGEIEERVTKMGFLSNLRSQPDEFCERLMTYVYPALDGRDYTMMLYFYTLLDGCGGALQGGLTASGHVKLLKKLKSVIKDLDYKALMTNSANVIEVIMPCLNSSNIATVAKLAKQIPDGKGGFLESSMIYCSWAVKFFWEGDGKKQPDTMNAWLHRYEACGEYIQKMQPAELRHFIQAVVFTSSARNTLDVDCRLELCRRMMKYCKQHTGKKKKQQQTEVHGDVGWDDLGSSMSDFVQHLETLSHTYFVELSQSEEARVREYLEMYDLSMGQADQIHRLLLRVMLEGQLSLESTAMFVTEASNTQLKMLLVDCLQYVEARLCNKENEFDLDLEPLVALTTMVGSVQEHISQGGTLVCAEDVLSHLRPFCSDSAIEVQPRLDVLHILEKSFELSEEDGVLLTLYRTQAILASIWPQEQIKEEDICNNDAREKTFSQYLDRSCKEGGSKGFLALCELLKLWPNFTQKQNDTCSPWVQLFKAMVTSGCHDNTAAVLETVKSTDNLSLNTQSVVLLYNLMLDASEPLLAVKFCLTTGHSETFDQVIDTLSQMPQIEEETELIQLLLEHHLVTNLVTTPHYTVIIGYILANQDADERCSVDRIARELSDSGYTAEAGSLVLQARSTHPMLQTFCSAVGNLKKFFK